MASKEQETTAEVITSTIEDQPTHFCESLTLDATADLSDNIPLIQGWWYGRKKSIQEKVKDRKYMLKLVLTSTQYVLSREELAKKREQIAVYKDMLHKIIGKSNGYPITLILESIKYEEGEGDTIYLSVVDNIQAECPIPLKEE